MILKAWFDGGVLYVLADSRAQAMTLPLWGPDSTALFIGVPEKCDALNIPKRLMIYQHIETN